MKFSRVRRFVIPAYLLNFWDKIKTILNWLRTDSSWITNINDIYCIFNYENHNSTGSWFIYTLFFLKCYCRKELLFSFHCSLLYGHCDILGKLRRHYNIVMKCILNKFSTFITSVTIEYAKYLNFRPQRDSWLLFFWLYHIQNYSDSIFICFSNCSNISICCKTTNSSKRFSCYFGRLKLWQCCYSFLFSPLN